MWGMPLLHSDEMNVLPSEGPGMQWRRIKTKTKEQHKKADKAKHNPFCFPSVHSLSLHFLVNFTTPQPDIALKKYEPSLSFCSSFQEDPMLRKSYTKQNSLAFCPQITFGHGISSKQHKCIQYTLTSKTVLQQNQDSMPFQVWGR